MAARRPRSASPSARPGQPRRPGRPARARLDLHVRERLLEEAGRLFSRHGVGNVSIRRIAEAAGVTPAMVHYYFGDRRGLCDALLGRALTRVLTRVRELERLDELPGAMIAALGADPWIAPLMVQEVLSEGGHYRERFVGEYASHMAELVPGLVRSEIQRGRVRGDLDPSLAMFSLLGMAVFPFVARPILERVFGLDYDPAFLERLAEHTRRVFFEGVRS